MNINERTVGTVKVLDIKGQITFTKGDEILKDKIHSVVHQGDKKILVNLAGVDYVDSAGLGELVGDTYELDSGADSIERAARLCGQGDATAAVRALTEVQVRDLAATLRELLQDVESGAQRIGAILKGLRELARQDGARPDVADVGAP